MSLKFFEFTQKILKNPQTFKVTQLSFSQLRIKESRSVRNKFKPLLAFFGFLAYYVRKKQKKLLLLVVAVFEVFFRSLFKSKSFFTIKLIWGRGKLGKPLLHIGTLILATLVFLTGGVFRKNLIVLSKGEQEAFITSSSDILPQPILVATQVPTDKNRESVITYIVAEGDTLSSIGKRFAVTVDTLRYANNITNIGYLKLGQELQIPPVNGIVYKVKSGDTLETLSKKYSISEQAIADFNYLSKPFILEEGQDLVLPDANIPAPVLAIVPRNSTVSPSYSGAAYTFIPYAGSGATGTGTFIWPTNNHYISQYFSWYHPAVDIAMQSPIYASDGGVVVRSGWWTNGYGFAIQLDHRNGYVSTYGHMSQLNVSVGDEVSQGNVIGIMGSTGRSTGPHVHFTIQLNGQFIDPLEFF